jgi:large conductance mechanosensitive channel
MLQEFKTFLLRGNVLDLAVGIVIGAAFGAIVTSFVADLLMPPVGLALGRANFADLFVSLDGRTYASLAAAKAAGAPTLNYGAFLTTIVNFLLIGFAVFLVVRAANRLMPRTPPAPPVPTRECPRCTSAIPLRATKCPLCTAELAPAV